MNIKVKATCPELTPRDNPEDLEILKELYSKIDARLDGILDDMEKAKCTKLGIIIGPDEVVHGCTIDLKEKNNEH